MKFEEAVQFILLKEGGYVNDPNDPGGETNFGISKRAYPNEDIKNMTKERAIEIYRKDYWNELNLDNVTFPMKLVMFDTAVNMGVTASKQLKHRCDGWEDYLFYRLEYYSRLPTARFYLRGWVNRILSLVEVIRRRNENSET
jgi:lysozyme family protein